VLPDDDDEGISADTVESPSQWPRAVHDSLDEFQSMLVLVSQDIDPIVKNFPMILPTRNAAIVLARLLRELYDVTEKYKRGEKEGRQKVLDDFRKSTMGAAIAAKFLTEEGISIDRTNEIFEHLYQFQRKLKAVMQTYRSTSNG
jgi:hypothetical protein